MKMRLSNITLRHKLMYRNSDFIAVLHLSQSRVFNNDNNLYFKMIVTLCLACSWAIFFTSVDKRYIRASLSFWRHLMYKMLFPDVGLSTRKQNTGEVILHT